MFGSATLSLIGALLVLSVLAHDGPLFLISLVLLLAAVLSRVWERYCLAGLEYRRCFSKHHVAFGQMVDLDVEIVNRKILPLSWLEIEDEIPRVLPPSRGKVYASHKPVRALLSSLIALRPYERIRRHYPIPCVVRGEHEFGPVRLRTGDLFGLVSREVILEDIVKLVVYPRVLPLTALGLPAQNPLGDLRTQSWLFEDPSRLAGLREYRPGDGLRRIHWAATARLQRLQVKVYEPTTSHKLVIFLNLRSTPGGWWGLDYDPDALELAIATAASIAAWALAEGYHVGLVTNGMHRFVRHNVSVDPGSDPSHLSIILDALARLQPLAVRPFEQTLEDGGRQLGFGSTIVAVSAVVTAPIASQLIALRHRGHPVTLVETGRRPVTPSLDGVAIRRVGPPEGWRDMPSLSLAER